MPTLEETFEQAVTDGVFPGAVILSMNKSGKSTYGKAFGKTSMDEGAKDLQLNSVFQIASMTKLMTSIAALQLVEKGLIGLDEDMSPHIPELASQGVLQGFTSDGKPIIEDRKNPLKLRYLLTHSSGAAYSNWDPKLLKYEASRGRLPGVGSTMSERFVYPLIYEPGTSWNYGTGIDWAGRVVEKVTGETLEDYMRKAIWDPLGIKNISFWAKQNPDMNARLAGMTTRDPASGKVVTYTGPFLNDNSKDCFGGHGAYADLTDYLKILHSILADDEKLLKKATTALMFQPQLSKESKAAQKTTMNIPEIAGMFVGDFPTSIDYDWGLGGILVEGDNEGRRKKGTLIWSGLPNLFWFIDRTAGLCGVFGTQVLPNGDPKVEETIKAFEFAMNQKLVAEI